MAMRDLLALVDDRLGNVFHATKPDPAKLRAPVLKAIERTRNQFAQTEPVRGPKWWRASNNVVSFTPTLRGGRALTIDGKETVYVPSERFGQFLDHLQAVVEAGEFDKQLEEDDSGAVAPAKVTKARKERDPNAPKRPGWTPERRKAFADTIAKKKAAKGTKQRS